MANNKPNYRTATFLQRRALRVAFLLVYQTMETWIQLPTDLVQPERNPDARPPGDLGRSPERYLPAGVYSG